jgi:hypothetical protein
MTIRATSKVKVMEKEKRSTLLSYLLVIFKAVILVIVGGGLIFGLFQSIKKASYHGFIDGIEFGSLLALTAIPIIVVIDLMQRLKCYLNYKIFDLGIEQERRFLIEDDYMPVFNRLQEVLDHLKRIDCHQQDIENGHIQAVARPSWRSFGENIDIELSKASKDKVVAVLSSKPRMSLTMIDYGKNLENVEIITKGIMEAFARDDRN